MKKRLLEFLIIFAFVMEFLLISYSAQGNDESISQQIHLTSVIDTGQLIVKTNTANLYSKPDKTSVVIKKINFLSYLDVDRTRLKDMPSGWIPIPGQDAGIYSHIAGWIVKEDVVVVREMKPWRGCWPFKEINFYEGDYAAYIKTEKNGDGMVRLADIDGYHPIKIYGEDNIIDIRDKKNGSSYLYSSINFKNKVLFSPGVTWTKLTTRPCN